MMNRRSQQHPQQQLLSHPPPPPPPRCCCIIHPHHNSVGVCGFCLQERLLSLVGAAAEPPISAPLPPPDSVSDAPNPPPSLLLRQAVAVAAASDPPHSDSIDPLMLLDGKRASQSPPVMEPRFLGSNSNRKPSFVQEPPGYSAPSSSYTPQFLSDHVSRRMRTYNAYCSVPTVAAPRPPRNWITSIFHKKNKTTSAPNPSLLRPHSPDSSAMKGKVRANDQQRYDACSSRRSPDGLIPPAPPPPPASEFHLSSSHADSKTHSKKLQQTPSFRPFFRRSRSYGSASTTNSFSAASSTATSKAAETPSTHHHRAWVFQSPFHWKRNSPALEEQKSSSASGSNSKPSSSSWAFYFTPFRNFNNSNRSSS